MCRCVNVSHIYNLFLFSNIINAVSPDTWPLTTERCTNNNNTIVKLTDSNDALSQLQRQKQQVSCACECVCECECVCV